MDKALRRWMPDTAHAAGCFLTASAWAGPSWSGSDGSNDALWLGFLGIGLSAWAFHLVCRQRRSLQRAVRSKVLGLAHQERQALVGTLAASTVHDIRNMLTSLTGNLELAQQQTPGDGAHEECIADATLAARRIQHLTQALHDYARPSESRKPVVEPLTNVAAEALRLVRPLARRGPALRFEPLCDLAVSHQNGELQQVFVNLLRNAIEIVGPLADGVVWMRIEPSPRGVRAVVEDNGPGIPQSVRNHLFDPFATSRPQDGGTGLGLYISRRIARNCGGELTGENAPGGGARFVLELPAVRAARALHTAEAPAHLDHDRTEEAAHPC